VILYPPGDEPVIMMLRMTMMARAGVFMVILAVGTSVCAEPCHTDPASVNRIPRWSRRNRMNLTRRQASR
jgi:hypothetical protein